MLYLSLNNIFIIPLKNANLKFQQAEFNDSTSTTGSSKAICWIDSNAIYQFSSVQSLSSVRLFATPWTAAHKAFLSTPVTRVYPNSCPLSQWCHPTISSSVVPFSSCHQSFPASWSFLTSQFFPSGGQNTGVSTSTSVLPVNTQD